MVARWGGGGGGGGATHVLIVHVYKSGLIYKSIKGTIKKQAPSSVLDLHDPVLLLSD